MSDEKLTEAELRVLDFLESQWHYYELMPDDEAIKRCLQRENPSWQWRPLVSYSKTKFRTAMLNRGLPSPPVESKYEKRLEGIDHDDFTPAQIASVVVLTDYMDTSKSDKIKLREIGVTTAQFNGWMRDPKFKKFFNTVSRKHYSESQHLARKGIISGMERGDLAAIKYFNEQTGESPEHQNIQVLLSRLVEAIQLHVKDPQVLYAIEQSFSRIMGNNMAIEAEILPSPVAEIEKAIHDL